MKIIYFFLLFFFPILLFSQQKFSKEISFVNDNDLYVSTHRDRYYTNGMFLNYRFVTASKKETVEKKIIEWQIGHKMFTPFRAVVENVNLHDRPFAAVLSGSFGINRAYKNNTLFKTAVQFGVIGPNAFGKEFQDFIHKIYGFKKAIGWEYQIKNALVVNFFGSYTKSLKTSQSKMFDISWINDVNFGTIYTDVSSGFNLRFGFEPLQEISNSIGFGTNLNNENTDSFREVESFFFLKPMLRYALYDATIEGSFLNTASEVTKEIVPLVFNIEIGLKFTVNRFHFGYTFNYNTSTSKNLRYTYGNKFGTLKFNYLLR